MTARRFRLRGTVFLPGRRIPLREPKSLPLGSPWTFDSLSYRGLPSEGEGQPSRGETAPGDCGCADAYEELPQLHTYDVDTEIPPAQSPIGARVRARPCGQSPRRHPNPAQLLPARPFPTTQCAGFLCNLGLLNGGGSGAQLRPGQDVARPRIGQGSSTSSDALSQRLAR